MPPASNLLDGLNKAQAAAVEFQGGPLAVLAGPGTGKTRVITRRVAYLIRERRVPPEQIVAVTYTVKAASELRERLAALVGESEAARVHAQTFHRLGLDLVRRFSDEIGLPAWTFVRGQAAGVVFDQFRGAGILDSAQHKRLLRSILINHRGPYGERLFERWLPEGPAAAIERIGRYFALFGDHAVNPEDIMGFVDRTSQAAAEGRTVSGTALDPAARAMQAQRLTNLRDAGRAWERYREVCRARGLMTFSDLILHPIHLLRSSVRARATVQADWPHIVVDEFQDVNAAMIELLRLLAPPESRPDLCVVGDDDQAIFGFRGADDRAFDHFSTIWKTPERIDLSENYRSVEPIVRVANSIMSRAIRRFAPDKKIVARRKDYGSPLGVWLVSLGADAEDIPAIAEVIRAERAAESGRPWGTFAVIARINTHIAAIHAGLTAEGIPASIRTRADAMSDEGVKDVMDWAMLLVNPDALWSAFRLLIRPPWSMPLNDVAALRERYRKEVEHPAADSPAPEEGDSFMAWLARQSDLPASARSLVERWGELKRAVAGRTAAESLEAIISKTDPAHAEPLDDDARADGTRNLARLLRFVRERQARLETPGDLGAFLSYMEDLDEGDRVVGDESMEDRIDGPRPEVDESTDAVRVITAHSAKGLEFRTVFVPRVSPNRGYPRTAGGDEAVELPAGFLTEPGELEADDRQACEERRIFYVACTRAMDRLVLLAKKNKRRSKSTHYFEELLDDASLKNSIVATDRSAASAPTEDEDDESGALPAGAGGLPLTLVRPILPLRLSYSAIKTYIECPRCYYVANVLGLSPAPIAVQLVGLAAHTALERLFEQRRAAGPDYRPSRGELAELAHAAFMEHSPSGRPVDQAQLDQVIAQIARIPEVFADASVDILELERPFRIPFGPHTLSGRIDRIDRVAVEGGEPGTGYAIIDYKSGYGSAAIREPKPDDLQLGIYALALAHEFKLDPDNLRGRAEYWVLSLGVRGVIALDKLRLDKVRSKIEAVIDGILAGRFEKSRRCKGTCDVLGAGAP